MNGELTHAQQRQVEDALLKAFSLAGLKQLVRREMGLRLEDEMSVERGAKFIVTDLVELAANNGWLERLLRGARRENSSNPDLSRAVRDLGIGAPPPAPAGDAAGDLLEKTVRARAPYLKYTDFVARLGALGPRICRIEIPEGQAAGTGWLVGPDLVLTAYHVIEDLVGGAGTSTAAARDVGCRFDYSTNDGVAGAALGGTVCALASDWLVDKSPYAAADVRAQGPEPTDAELDYALLRLDRPVGDDAALNGGRRGWIEVPEDPPVATADDIMLIAQHPDGRTLELAWGRVLGYNGAGNRLRYDANTLKGSSGAPCFDVTLTPFGVHHAGGPGAAFQYNQCVPLRRVIAHMKTAGSTAFWTKKLPMDQG